MFSVRYKDYLRHYGVITPGQDIILEIQNSSNEEIKVSLEKLVWNSFTNSIHFALIRNISILGAQDDILTISIGENLNPGYYLLRFRSESINHGLEMNITYKEHKPIAIIKPVFTQWVYHSNGFYYNAQETFLQKCMNRIRKLLGNRYKHIIILNKALRLAGLRKLARVFPANYSISLNDFYITNNKWKRNFFSREFSNISGLWFDELVSVFPIFALLEKNKIPYNIYTDIDLHLQNPQLEKHNLIVFYGQEGITKSYYTFLKKLSKLNIPMILWGVQGFGYREYEYDEMLGVLRYVCTRGKLGMWGDPLEKRQPSWGVEGELFGFQFPEPKSPFWRREKYYSKLHIIDENHWLIKKSGVNHQYYTYEIIQNGIKYPGLTWAGGEIQRKYKQEAKVIACLDDNFEVIGIGEFKNFLIFSPTYLPAFFAYQYSKHSEIEKFFLAAMNYYLGV